MSEWPNLNIFLNLCVSFFNEFVIRLAGSRQRILDLLALPSWYLLLLKVLTGEDVGWSVHDFSLSNYILVKRLAATFTQAKDFLNYHFFSFGIPPASVFFFQKPDTPFRASVRFTVYILAPRHHPPVGSRPVDLDSSLSPSARIHSGTVACNGREIAGPARQSCLVPVIIAAVRSVSRCLLPNNYPSAVLTGGEGGEKKKVCSRLLLGSRVL